MNRALFRLSLACLAMFVLLLLNVNYVQAFEAGTLATKAGNARIFDQQFQYQRGAIVRRRRRRRGQDRRIAADQGHQRVPAVLPGRAGVRPGDRLRLDLQRHRHRGRRRQGTRRHRPQAGRAQPDRPADRQAQAGRHGLPHHQPEGAAGRLPGAEALRSPSGARSPSTRSTGAILALASYPTFNPNAYATLDGTKLRRIDNAYLRDPGQPLLNRATMATFPPGSSFKIVTSSTAFSTGKVANPQTTVPAPTSLPLPGSTVSLINDSNEACGNGHPPLILAFTLSCNTAFGGLGIKLGNPALHKYATAFGMNNPNLTIPLPVAQSNYPVLTDRAQTALSAIGQFDDTVTPLQEAMFAATIANNGTLMKPYLVQQVQAPDLSPIQNASPSVLAQPVSSQVAGYVRQMMVQVTNNPAGTAYATANQNVAGVLIAGKTGTAQNGDQQHQPQRRGLHLFRTCQQPADSRRRHSQGRWLRRRRRGADRSTRSSRLTWG